MTPDEQSPPGRERLITVKTRAVIPVGLYGLPKVKEAQRSNKAAYSIGPRAFNLPSALKLDEAQVDRVCGLLKMFLGQLSHASSPKPSPARA
jgi:dTDP-4-amino-4,6-dideoxygalactose transaminase